MNQTSAFLILDKNVKHSYFQKLESKDNSIPPHVKQSILDNGKRFLARNEEKVICRSETRYMTFKDSTEISKKRFLRRKELETSGFNSSYKDPYTNEILIVDMFLLVLRYYRKKSF